MLMLMLLHTSLGIGTSSLFLLQVAELLISVDMVFSVVFLPQFGDNVLGSAPSGMLGHNGCILFLLCRHALGFDRNQMGWNIGMIGVSPTA